MSDIANSKLLKTQAAGAVDGKAAERGGMDIESVVEKAASNKRKKTTPRFSLNESVLVEQLAESRAALEETQAKGQEVSKEQLLEDRRAANRLSAYQSRMRRKAIVHDLEMTVSELTKRQEEQTKEIEKIRKEIQRTGEEKKELREAIMTLRDRKLAQNHQMNPPTQHSSGNGVDDKTVLTLHLLAEILQQPEEIPPKLASREQSFLPRAQDQARGDALEQALHLLLSQSQGGMR